MHFYRLWHLHLLLVKYYSTVWRITWWPLWLNVIIVVHLLLHLLLIPVRLLWLLLRSSCIKTMHLVWVELIMFIFIYVTSLGIDLVLLLIGLGEILWILLRWYFLSHLPLIIWLTLVFHTKSSVRHWWTVHLLLEIFFFYYIRLLIWRSKKILRSPSTM